jgi:hypothetical protein
MRPKTDIKVRIIQLLLQQISDQLSISKTEALLLQGFQIKPVRAQLYTTETLSAETDPVPA